MATSEKKRVSPAEKIRIRPQKKSRLGACLQCFSSSADMTHCLWNGRSSTVKIIEVGTSVANGVGIGATKASKRSRCPLMPLHRVPRYRVEPRGRDYTHDYKNH